MQLIAMVDLAIRYHSEFANDPRFTYLDGILAFNEGMLEELKAKMVNTL